ncbi:hypothetical protein GUJ93_ZPchr0001g30415 [Zizania palustris]|uniref:DUF7597 domain-containing protein n=1 Tax=Zizania palustris TaxID=103762 RepID=A0A8J5S5X4_ZIZPA|nr:hypothetical protein GUJ93_ZPchr0001g30415 [Zizania palustris]
MIEEENEHPTTLMIHGAVRALRLPPVALWHTHPLHREKVHLQRLRTCRVRIIAENRDSSSGCEGGGATGGQSPPTGWGFQQEAAVLIGDPLAYVPRGGVLLDGGGELRKVRNVVALSGQHIRKNEDLAIANCEEFLTAVERHEFLLMIHHHLTQVLRLQVLRILLKVLVDQTIDIPRSITVKSCHSMDGEGRSWTFPVYIIGNVLADGFPADEDELPPNGGNPHPFNGEVFPGDPNWVQQWVDDQLPHAGFPNNNIVEQVFPEQQGNINPMEDPPQWEQWPNHNSNAPQVPQQQEELSVEVSGLSVGLNSGSTTASGSNSSGPSTAQHNSMSFIPRALSPPLIPRAPIRLVYSRRQRNLNNDNVTSNMATSAISSVSYSALGLRRSERIKARLQGFKAPHICCKEANYFSQGSQKKGDKGKGIMLPGLPSIQDFVCATTDDQVGRDRLMAEAGTSTQLVQAHTNAQLDEENEG